MKLKGLHFADVTEMQEAVTDELKKVQKEEFSAAFQKLYDAQNPVYMPMEFELKKKVRVFLMRLRFLKIPVLKFLDRTGYCGLHWRVLFKDQQHELKRRLKKWDISRLNSITEVVDTVCNCKLSLHFPLYEVCLKSNDTKRVARELAIL